MNLNELSDRIALKELIDKVSILADKKDFENQVLLFSEDAISETYADGISILKLKSHEEMKTTFTNFLKDFDTVYHFNGQQVVTINGDNAKGTSYCLITLIGMENGNKTEIKIGATYQDTYIRKNNSWLISKRIGSFEWQEKHSRLIK